MINKRIIMEYNFYLLLFITIKIIQLVIALYIGDESVQYISEESSINMLSIRIITTSICAVLVYCSYKRMMIPLVITSIIMFFSGLGTVGIAVLSLLNQQIVFGVVSLVIGSLLTYGGIRILYIQRKFFMKA